MTGTTAAPLPERPNLRAPILTGGIILFLFALLFVFWGFGASLDSAAVAPGSVIVESNRRTIQHFEGGIVGKILVREGDKVTAGQVLVHLDDTQSRARLDLVNGRLLAVRAQESRLITERDDGDAINFPADLAARRGEPAVDEALSGQERIFESRRETLVTQTAVLNQQVRQLEEEIGGLRGEIKAEERQLELIDEEARAVEGLVKKGLERRPRLLALQRRTAEIEGMRSQNVSAIARAEQNIGETILKISQLKTARLEEIVGELRDTQTELFDLGERVRAAEDVLLRGEIRAPIAGTVVGLAVHTQGGVIQPGGPILDIVPSGERLIVEARIDPNDIDVVYPGLRAQVRLTALPQRNVPPIEGHVMFVSADRILDEQTRMPYFAARISIDEIPAELADTLELYPGMQAETIIVTGARSPADFLLKPLFSGINRAMREQ